MENLDSCEVLVGTGGSTPWDRPLLFSGRHECAFRAVLLQDKGCVVTAS